MEFLPDKISELSALATILITVLFVAWKGIPQLIAYLERKDSSHRDEIRRLIDDARAERDASHERLVVSLSRIHDRLDNIESAICVTKPRNIND
jgi:hypothetical protein